MLAPNPPFVAPVDLNDLFDPACVDIFAGCGGWSIGAEQAFADAGWRDRKIDLMLNHWDVAVGVHKANHPLTQHLRADVREVDPDDVLPGRRIAYLHASPDCTDHSKAKGGKPRRKEIRALADVVIVWAAKRRPDVITLENVEEFRQWGPLLDCGQPDPARRGQEFLRWKGELEALGYQVEARELRACDYGAPTTRKRLFVIARRDGKEIIWPEKTHAAFADEVRNVTRNARATQQATQGLGAVQGTAETESFGEALRAASGEVADKSCRGRKVGAVRFPLQGGQRGTSRSAGLLPYLSAADCIDWSIPMLSIFATPEEAKAFGRQHGVGTPRRPLQPKTLARIAGGLDKFVLKAKKPFIIRTDMVQSNSSCTYSGDSPLTTICTAPSHAAVDVSLAPYSVPRYGERPGQEPRCQSIEQPAATITGTGNGTNLVSATLVRCAHGDESNGGKRWGASSHDVTEPVPTVIGSKDYAVAAVHLSTLNHGGAEHRATSPDAPLPTVCGSNDARALVAALVTKHYTGVTGSAADAPLDTVTGTDHNAITCAYLSHFYTSNSRGGEGDPLKPAKTITCGGQHAAVTVALMEKHHAGSEVTLREAAGQETVGAEAVQALRPREASHRLCDETGVQSVREASRGTSGGAEGNAAAGMAERARQGAAVPFVVGAGGAAYAAKPVGVDRPANTVIVNDRRAIVAAFLATYYGNGGTSSPADGVPTVVGKDRIQLVTVTIDGTTYVVTDIAMRMLTPRELANAQGFPADYQINRTADGRTVTKADQVKLIGNAVPPTFSRAIVKANVVEQGVLGEPIKLKRRRTKREAVAA